jgi:hypothetical protein
MRKYLVSLLFALTFLSTASFAQAETIEQCRIRVADDYNLCASAAGGSTNLIANCYDTLAIEMDACNALPIVTGTTSPSTPPPATGFPIRVTGNGASSTGGTAPVTLTNPLGTTDIRLLIARVISAVLSIIGVIALLMFVYGGFLWMISGGNESQVEKGKEVLKWTTLGIILIVSAYVIVNAIFRAAFTGAL